MCFIICRRILFFKVIYCKILRFVSFSLVRALICFFCYGHGDIKPLSLLRRGAAQEFIDAHAQKLRQLRQQRNIRVINIIFPLTDCLWTHTQLTSQPFLRCCFGKTEPCNTPTKRLLRICHMHSSPLCFYRMLFMRNRFHNYHSYHIFQQERSG